MKQKERKSNRIISDEVMRKKTLGDHIDHNPNFETLDFSKTIYVLFSGGRDSSSIVLSLWSYCKTHKIDTSKIILLFGDTRIARITARRTINKITTKTGFRLEVAKYEGREKPIQILNRSFMKIHEAIEIKKRKKGKRTRSYKNLFVCCELLKKKPMTKVIKKLPRNDTIVILGIKAGDNAQHRKFRLRELRDKETFYRRHKSHTPKGLLYYYPLRDCDSIDIDRVLQKHGFEHIQSSGCSYCPIFVVGRNWEKKDPKTYVRSLIKAKTLGLKLEERHERHYRIICTTYQETFDL